MKIRRLGAIGTAAGAAYLIIVPLAHLPAVTYPHMAAYGAMSHVRVHAAPVPNPNPYLPLAPVPAVSHGAPRASSAGSGGGGHHAVRGYLAYRLVRHVFYRHRRWGFRSPIRNPLPWWLR